VKYANADPYPANVAAQLRQDIPADAPENADWCQLVDYTRDLEAIVLAAVIYRYKNIGYAQAIQAVQLLTQHQKAELIQEIFSAHSRYTAPLREVEHSSFTFDITLDQGAWYEVKRHRMLTLTTQPFTPALGYTIPLLIQQAGCQGEYETLMQECIRLYPRLEEAAPGVGSYILPNAFKRRFLVTANLRSLIHFINLRSADNAHYSVRRLALRMAEQMRHILPDFAPCLFYAVHENWQEIEKKFFAIP